MHKSSRVITRLVVSVFCLALLIPAAQSQTKRRSTIKKAPARTVLHIPQGTEMKIRLQKEINTQESRDGDRFTAVVLTPSRYADATVEGHVAKINKSGKLSGKTEL